ncbi:hypothetical protein BJV77DRAFT_1073001 [Russula vinacea]|nr:hypothetical protein BJV77DRAFT_1073001 [Russula vinacea]
MPHYYSHTHLTAASSSNFQLIINAALKLYRERTKNDIFVHPLATQLQICDDVRSFVAVLQEQVQRLDHSRNDHERWKIPKKWRGTTLNVLLAIAGTLGVVGLLVFLIFIWRIIFPVDAIIVAIWALLSAANDAGESRNILEDAFERIECFVKRLEIYTEVPLTTEMMDMIVQIMVEVLVILEIATNEIEQGQMKRIVMKLPVIASTDLDDAFYRLKKLTHEEALMAVAQTFKERHTIDEGVKGVVNTVMANGH